MLQDKENRTLAAFLALSVVVAVVFALNYPFRPKPAAAPAPVPSPPAAQTAAVPDVTGLPLADAQQALTAAGFAVEQAPFEDSEGVPAGHVARQVPLGGSACLPGTVVALAVSRGPGAAPAPADPDAPEPGTLAVDFVPPHSYRVRYLVPSDGVSHPILVKVTDESGTRVALNESVAGGAFERTVTAGGGTVVIRLYDFGEKVDEKTFLPSEDGGESEGEGGEEGE